MTPLIETDRLHLFEVSRADTKDLQSYYVQNAAHLDPWEPKRSPDFHMLSAWERRVTIFMLEAGEGRAVRFVLRHKTRSDLIGVCNFTNLVRGPFQACTLGYSIDKDAQGQGLMVEALTAAIAHMFNAKKLHRIMANYVPENARSGALLARLGFEIEGRAKDYLQINGAWKDHVLTAKLNPNYEDA